MSCKRSFVLLLGDPLITGIIVIIIRDKIRTNAAIFGQADCCFFITVTQEFEEDCAMRVMVSIGAAFTAYLMRTPDEMKPFYG
jgi:hypothetical protein